MVDMQSGLEKAREEMSVRIVHDLICPPHPQRSDIRLRVGLDKRGHLVLFEPINGGTGAEDWRRVGPCSAKQVRELQPHLDKYVSRQGPGGCTLFYYEPPGLPA